MPVLFDSSAAGDVTVGSGATSTSKTLTHQVSTRARDRIVAFVAVLWNGEADTTGATFGVTFGGVAMTQIAAQTWNSNKSTLRLFKLEDAPTGTQSVVASVSSMPTEVFTARYFLVESVTYSGINTVGDPVTAGGSSATANTVAVSSVLPAHRVFTAHGVGKTRRFTAYNQTKRQQIASGVLDGKGSLLIGDAPGAATVTATATHNSSTANWGAIGVAMTPSVVGISAKIKLRLKLRASLAKFRFADPHPDRDWTVPPIDSADPNELAGNFDISPDGVAMPVWIKDVDDTLDYTLRWYDHLAPDDDIVHVEHSVAGTTLRIESEDIGPDGGMTQVWLSGGSVHVNQPVRVRFTTRKGRRHDRTFFVSGVNN